MKLAGKLALVTGGTDGIGREIARQLRAKGASVVVAGRDPERIAAARADGFEVIAADLSTIAGCDALLAAVDGRQIDILVNNAGRGVTWRIDEPVVIENVDACVFLNLNAPIRLITALLPVLRERPEAMIVNVTSGLAIAPRAGSPVYCATKAALKSFTQSLRAQLRGSRVQVLEALPPVVETRMTADNPHAKMPAAECARQIIAAMEAGRAEANVGLTRLLAGVHNVAPWLARRIMIGY
jgi:uncharacterized oxidoreductase